MMQVIVLGHRLHQETNNFIHGLDPYAKIFLAPFHCSNFSKVVSELVNHFKNLKEEGLQTGGCRTILVTSGSSVVSVTAVAVWAGMTGEMPEILNLIRRENDKWVPSPELPLIALDSIKQRLRSENRSQQVGITVIPVSALAKVGESQK